MATTAERSGDRKTAPAAGAPVRTRREGRLARNLRTIGMVWQRELIRFVRSPARIVSGLAQPVLFLFVLGAGIEPLVGDRSAGGVDYQEFIFPGVVAMSVLFSSLFSAISIVWDREFGFLREMLVAPVSTASILIGKALGGATVATAQCLVLLALAGLVGVPYDLPMMLTLVVLIFLMGLQITTLGLVLAARIRQVQSAMPLVQLIITPLMFLSGALFPLSGLPTWLAVLTHINPMTYAVEPLRHVVFAHLDVDAATRARFDPGIVWGDWAVPVGLQVAITVGITVLLMLLAVVRFRRTE
jgi:ABC-2 type transport system permease protein